jgi:4-hydroxythreonine-4-phosphate dehydrogenase
VKKPVIAIATGDPNGIGPEIAVKAALDPRVRRLCTCVLFGAPYSIVAAAEASDLPLKDIPLWDTGVTGAYPCFGKATPQGGWEAIAAVDAALEAVRRKTAAALVTAPLCKEAVVMSGRRGFTGHTEYLARKSGSRRFCLSLFSDDKCIAFVSTHVPLKKAVLLVKKKRIMETALLLHDFFRRLGFSRPRLAVAGLNPHAGEAGLFGFEERREIAPAVRALRKKGLCVEGPLPPDTAFPALFGGRFDGAVSLIHDHGCVAFKTACLSLGKNGAETSGVNVTLGLPFVRTSVDHGTAFDIAGKGRADPGSMVEAIELAVRLAKRR